MSNKNIPISSISLMNRKISALLAFNQIASSGLQTYLFKDCFKNNNNS